MLYVYLLGAVPNCFTTARFRTRCHFYKELNTLNDIRMAVTYYESSRDRLGRAADCYLHKTEIWLKFSRLLAGLSEDDIATHQPKGYTIVQGKRA